MVRDFSAFLPGAAPVRCAPTSLEGLGWGAAFARQIDAEPPAIALSTMA